MSILTINTRATSLMHTDDTMIVLDKFKIDTWLFESVQSRLVAILPYLIQGHDYTVQELLGENFMSDMAMPRHLPTLCLKHLATQPDAALIEQPNPGCGTTRFQVAFTSAQNLS